MANSSTAVKPKDDERNKGQESSLNPGGVISSVEHKAEDATAAVGSGMKSLAGTIREKTPDKGMVGNVTGAVADTLESGGRYLEEQGLHGMANDFTDLIRRHPFQAILVGIGVGFLLARAFPELIMSLDMKNEAGPRLSKIFSGIMDDAQDLLKQHLALFKTEVQSDYLRTKEAALSLVLGVVFLLVGGSMLAMTLALLLSWAAPGLALWVCFGLVAFAVLAGGAAFLVLGKTQLKSVTPLASESVEAVREDAQWLMNSKTPK